MVVSRRYAAPDRGCSEGDWTPLNINGDYSMEIDTRSKIRKIGVHSVSENQLEIKW